MGAQQYRLGAVQAQQYLEYARAVDAAKACVESLTSSPSGHEVLLLS